jgi:DDE superfamily endonuclease
VKVRNWAAEHRNDIELVFLPAYAPEHNPDEYLNNDLKQQLKNQPKPNTQEDLVKATTSVLRSLQRRPARIRSYFHPQHVRYAA